MYKFPKPVCTSSPNLYVRTSYPNLYVQVPQTCMYKFPKPVCTSIPNLNYMDKRARLNLGYILDTQLVLKVRVQKFIALFPGSPRTWTKTAFPYCKQQKAGRGLGTRLAKAHITSLSDSSVKMKSTHCLMNTLGLSVYLTYTWLHKKKASVCSLKTTGKCSRFGCLPFQMDITWSLT